MRSRSIVLAIAMFSSVCLSGCALTTAKVDIQYVPQSGVTAIEGAKDVSVNVQVTDSRLEPKVGSKKNGFGMEMAQIRTNEDANFTFQKAIQHELKARGFALGQQDAVVNIDADLMKYYNDFKIGFLAGDAIAEMNMGVTIKSRKGDLLYSRQFVTQGIERNIQLASGDNARLALERALAEGMKKLFEDKTFIAALVKSKK